ncbi:MAG: hypothetical protein JXA57_09810 [Armatimonadetes bacterium]|nr:hypothetical protein [Armatimonadota bacterium]
MSRTFCRLVEFGIAIAGLSLLLGCAQPSVPAEDFVGVWLGDYGEAGPPGGLQGAKLTLRGDGKGAYRETWDPHEQAIMWVLRGDEFVLTPRSGGLSTAWKYRLEDPDHLVLIDEDGNELKFRREETEAEGATDSPAAAEGEAGEETTSPEMH